MIRKYRIFAVDTKPKQRSKAKIRMLKLKLINIKSSLCVVSIVTMSKNKLKLLVHGMRTTESGVLNVIMQINLEKQE